MIEWIDLYFWVSTCHSCKCRGSGGDGWRMQRSERIAPNKDNIEFGWARMSPSDFSHIDMGWNVGFVVSNEEWEMANGWYNWFVRVVQDVCVKNLGREWLLSYRIFKGEFGIWWTNRSGANTTLLMMAIVGRNRLLYWKWYVYLTRDVRYPS